MNTYYDNPGASDTIRTIGRYTTLIHLDVRELTDEERQPSSTEGEEAPRWTADDVTFHHAAPLTDASYPALVAAIVRHRYTADDVEAITQNYIASKTAEHKAEWQQLQEWRAKAKEAARAAIEKSKN